MILQAEPLAWSLLAKSFVTGPPLNSLSDQIIGGAIAVHRALGPGLFESAYRRCLTLDLVERGLSIEEEVPVPLVYRGTRINVVYRMDLIIERAVIVEVKAIDRLAPIHTTQMISYLRLSGLKLGLLINFHVPVLKDGIRRVVDGFPDGRDSE